MKHASWLPPGNNQNAAFTVTELLVAMTVLAVLVSVGSGIIGGSLGKAAMSREIAAGKTLINAYLLHAAENNGRLLHSFDPGAADVRNPEGKVITMSITKGRYPFRLAPYFNNKLQGTILVNNNEKQIQQEFGKAVGIDRDYGISTYPALGINRYLVGGILPNNRTQILYPNECLTHQSQSEKSIIVFASASDPKIDGYENVIPPTMPEQPWSSEVWKKGANPRNYGNLAARHSDKVVCVYLNGSVQLQPIEELRDMRLWSKIAAAENNPNHIPNSN